MVCSNNPPRRPFNARASFPTASRPDMRMTGNEPQLRILFDSLANLEPANIGQVNVGKDEIMICPSASRRPSVPVAAMQTSNPARLSTSDKTSDSAGSSSISKILGFACPSEVSAICAFISVILGAKTEARNKKARTRRTLTQGTAKRPSRE